MNISKKKALYINQLFKITEELEKDYNGYFQLEIVEWAVFVHYYDVGTGVSNYSYTLVYKKLFELIDSGKIKNYISQNCVKKTWKNSLQEAYHVMRKAQEQLMLEWNESGADDNDENYQKELRDLRKITNLINNTIEK